jgi:hypothetical protein
LPDLIKVVCIDITLSERSVNVGTGGNGTVDQDRSYIDSCPAEEVAVSYQGLVFAYITLAAELTMQMYK